MNRAGRSGVTIETTRADADVEKFFALYARIAVVKGFRVVGSVSLMKHLLAAPAGAAVEAQLFVARHSESVAAGALVIRCGRSIHGVWQGTDRAFSRERVGEAVQWALIEWALSRDCVLFDQEGVDPHNNPSGYAFKQKLGGEEIILEGRQYLPCSARGHLITWLDQYFR